MNNRSRKTVLVERLLKLINALDKHDRLVKVRSWIPYIDDSYVCWPVMVINYPSKRVITVPVWDRVRLINIFKRNRV